MSECNLTRIYAILPRTGTLGPFLRFALWVQGCPRQCPGCMTPDARPLDGGYLLNINTLTEQIIADSHIEGLTVSGGEPFLQAESLSRLIDRVLKKRDIGVIVYSGYTLQELHWLDSFEKKQGVRDLLDRADILIDGPYIQEMDDGLSLRGSKNQVIHQLTGRYDAVMKQYYGQPRRNVELHLLKDEIFLAGIPGVEMLKKWKLKLDV